MTTNNNSISWNKIITLCSVFGIPAFSVLVGLIVWGVRLDDKLTGIGIKQQEQGTNITEISDKLDKLSIRVDTLSQRQRDQKRDIDYKFFYMEKKK